ncbi:hypothetical protein [Roseobacter sp. MH60115]|uniref:hypothetical protein n=1 Tax=Roseobacter sp. MH60115 TaxID=2785324 RepID=UPI0018A28A51|nr:hypothetical protein [Roseobacter sp. MH60115]
MKLKFLLVVACITLAACTPPIGEGNLTDLGKQTDAVSVALSSPLRVQQKMISETAKYNQLCGYLSGKTPELLPLKSRIKPTQTAREMNQVAGAIGAYAAALKEAAAGGSVAILASSADSFKAEASGLLEEFEADPSVSPAVEAGINVILRVGEANRMARVRAIMDDVYLTLVQLERRLVSDAPSVVNENRSFVFAWERSTKCVLNRVRSDRDVAIQYFDKFQKDRAEIERDTALTQKAPAAVRTLFEIHILIITEPVDPELTLKTLQNMYDEIEAVLEVGN